jgi:hypothetical protein
LSFRSWAQGALEDLNFSSSSSVNSSSLSVGSISRRLLNGFTGGGESDSKNKDDELSLDDLKSSNNRSTSKFHDSDITSITALMFLGGENGENQSQEDLGEEEEEEASGSPAPSSSVSSDSSEEQNSNKRRSTRNSVLLDDGSSDEGSIVFHDATEHPDEDFEENNHNLLSPSARSKVFKGFNRYRLICGKIVNDYRVQQMIVFLIVLNALQMGLSTFDFVDENPEIKNVFEKLDLAFLIVFTVEIVFQLIYHGYHLFQDGWLFFDFIIVIMSWSLTGMQVFRTLRTLRLIARVESLKKLIQALVESLPRVTGILFLFALIMYIYGVLCTVLFGDLYERGLTKDNYFSRLDYTLFTLFQMITLDWAKIVREVMAVYPFSWAVFSTYLSFTSFILFSLIIAVVCDAVSVVEHDANLVEMLEKKDNAQERILKLQQRVDFLKKEQLSVLGSVQDVLKELQTSTKEDNNFHLPAEMSTGTNTNGSSNGHQTLAQSDESGAQDEKDSSES